MMLWINVKRKFTVQELADDFQVSRRTVIRDLQELSTLGVPLLARPGSGGGYEVLRNRMLPPIPFTIEEVTSIFFAYQTLEKFPSLPFATGMSSALNRLYQSLPDDTKNYIDRLQGRFSYLEDSASTPAPHLRSVLDASVENRVLHITYHSRNGLTERNIQPIGVYARNGLWYCPAYCFTRESVREFRIDRIHSVSSVEDMEARQDIAQLSLGDWYTSTGAKSETLHLQVRLTTAGIRELAQYHDHITSQSDGSRILQLNISLDNVPFFARMFLTLGKDAIVQEPQEMAAYIRAFAEEIRECYPSASTKS
jgi:predicted DNA-binding transcriptional regulator YafY